jgi:hypothetical protein
MTKLPGTQFVAEIPTKAGEVVGIAEVRGRLLIACQFGVYELTEAAHPEPRKIREVIAIETPAKAEVDFHV